MRISVDPNQNIDNAYEQFLSANPDATVGAIKNFEETLHHSYVKYGRFTIPTFYKPHFITKKQSRLLHAVSNALVRMIDRLVSLYFTEPVISQAFNLSPEVAELIKIDPGYSRTAVIGRLDCFLEGERVQFMEFGCDATGGMAYTDLLEQIFFDQAELKEFFDEFHFDRDDRSQKLLDALLSAYEEFGGYETPRIAILDWKNVRTRAELELLKNFFESKGYKSVIADPRELRYKSGKLYLGNFKVDLIYRRVLVRELLEKLDEIRDFIQAYQDKAVCLVNPLRSGLAASKTFLSILTNPGYDHLFSEKENAIKKEHLPWTRRILDAEKFYGGKKIYLVDFLKDEKESLVLKPADSYGGRDVTIGRETRDEDWNRTIDKALKSNWIVQECLDAPTMRVPVVINNKLEFVMKKMSTSGFVFGGNYSGGFSRLSDETVINVSRGGGLIPTITSEAEIER